ncbi:hypothetical protein HBA55_26730 [Pseudomaricurvus alkylphenolicus]|jgi:hypothetical protein|uniref:hypothetical protein n=1 Tax=Pseudomaricurvus alkylphenolicus TaxID=1306991 RepID=UPI00141E7949|nr:hypothetical protein [Pseudomaricurvus alkylphenolicus]NIB43232.1 hypothetical protein [Pseudomaricurvus alkylphenolicus]
MIIDASAKNKELKLICSQSKHSEDPSKPLFFYHLQKTGGISFANPLTMTFNSIKEGQTLALRIETLEDLHKIKGHPFHFVTSPRLAYGAHKILERDYHLTAFFRHPYSRVKSHYTYTCMRAQEKPSDEGFEAFFRNPENCNLISKRLHPQAMETTLCDSQSVIENLQQNFHSYADFTLVNELLAVYLSLYKLPNVLAERVNKTLPEFRYDGEKYRDEILALNEEDTSVCDYVKANPRIPSLKDQVATEMSAHTLIFHEFEKLTATKQTGKTVNTQDLLRFLKQNHNSLISTGSFFQAPGQ